MSFSTTLIRIVSLLLLIWLLVGCATPTDTRRTTALFPMVEQGRWGFIDSTGAIVITPRFAQVQEFAEGLAPVREAGHYGFMDGTGHLVLAQSYGYASPFYHGLAVVQQDSTPQLIDRMGHLAPLAAAYKELEWQPGLDGGGLWVASLPSHYRQLLASTGKLLNTHVFNKIGQLSSNRVVVKDTAALRDREGRLLTEAVGVLDGRGKLVIPYYRFSSISTFHNGLATASLYQAGADAEPLCIIDTTGRILTRLPRNQEFADYSEAEFADDVVRVHISKDGGAANLDNSYPAVIDKQGRVLFHNRRLQRLTDFYHGRAWAQEKDDDWYLIDKAGRRLSTVAVQFLLGPGGHDAPPAFANGAEVVELANNEGYAALDSTGRVVRHLEEPMLGNSPQQAGDLLLFYGTDSLQRMGFWNWRTGLLVRERFSAISSAGYQHGLLPVLEDDRLGYLSPQGRYVWRAKPMPSTPLNLDFMRRGIYPVASAPLRRYAGAGGWGQSDNQSRPIGNRRFTAHALGVQVAQQATPGTFGKRYHGYALTISNTTADTIVFDAQDSSLSLTLQAQDKQGQWRDIEYSPSSWCGNSYHRVFLAPGQYWQLPVPAYAGEFPTQLRARLLHRRARGTRSQQVVVYSNSFAGSVNPAQFWRPQGYSPQGIMDPYLN
ncbi:WG repeat-containing protein [Hymenobacter setariae]|uniref:WG repeat-containing protein n=1 Tax=Hymenobacter setariae TaxID=2594794 RepID=A0A558BPK3_9BACT|nr:WG repeat-containing protein [Hymenobacter setariae]TVT38446.1 WG repeat-containing protein [Hymenobacter setariae]